MARISRKKNVLAEPSSTASDSRAQNVRMYRAGGYCRLSVEDSGRPGTDTIEAQGELISNFIEAQPDLRFCGLYCDNGWSGADFSRPSFERLMDDIRNGKIDCIVVKDLSRFGRNYLETGNYLERIFPYLDVRFIAINDNFDTLTAERSEDGYIIPLKNIINDIYSKDISRKIMPALATKQQNGEFIGTWAAYGYQKCKDDKHRIEPDPETAHVVQDIFRWRANGMSYTQIARKLNADGIASPSHYHYLKGDTNLERYAEARWAIQVVKRILENEVYIGHMVQGRKRSRFAIGKKQAMMPKSDWVIVRNTHDPLIDEETFRIVQQMSEKCVESYRKNLGKYDALGKPPNLLRGLIWCADCGKPLVRYKEVRDQGKRLDFVYICPTHSREPLVCPKKHIREPLLIQVLKDAIQSELTLVGAMEKLVQETERTQRKTDSSSVLGQEAAAEKALARAKRLYDSLYQNYVDKLMDEQEYVEMKSKYWSEIERASSELEEIRTKQDAEQRNVTHNSWLTEFGKYQGNFEFTEEMAHALIERVELDADNHISITLRYRDEFFALAKILGFSEKAVGNG